MVINTDNLVSITEANQNFSRVARMVDENEMCIRDRWMYAAIAPIPLSTFAGEPTSSVGKNFIRSYAGVCLQGVVTVSYTHLDVYKRQVQPLALAQRKGR